MGHPHITNISKSSYKQCFFALPGIFHASELARGDRPEICEKHGWDFVLAEYPSYTFSLDAFVLECIQFLETHSYEKIIVCGLSFGEIVAREIVSTASHIVKKHIIQHISLCGVSTFKQLSVQKQRPIIASTKIRYAPLVYIVKKSILLSSYIEHTGIFGIRKHSIGKRNYAQHDLLSLERAQNIIVSGSKGIKPSLYERGNIVAQTTTISPIDVPTIAIYASGDPFFTNAQHTAQTILDHCTQITSLICAHPGGHASLVEFPDTYNPILEDILRNLG